jgi:hypothetical protein
MSITHRMPTARGLALVAAVASLAAAPAASAASSHHGGDQRGGARHSAAPSRVTDRAQRAAKAVGRASDAVDDGDAAKATAALKAARTNLASALKTATKHVTAADSSGPASADAVLAAQHRVASAVANLFDGQDSTTVADLATTLKAADDGRDALIASIAALTADDQADYGDALGAASDDVADELSDLADALGDDTLTDDAEAALTAAATQLKATQTALAALTTAGDTASSDDGTDYLGGASTTPTSTRGDCPKGGHGTADTGSSTGGDYLS